MEGKKTRLPVKLIAIFLVIALCAPIGTLAATPETVMPLTSDYITDYTGYICVMGDGELEIWWEVFGTNYWANIGATKIYLYESTDNFNFYWVKTFKYADYPNMLWHDTYISMDHVDYEGVPGRYYKAYVQILVGPEDGGDARSFWTPVVLCT